MTAASTSARLRARALWAFVVAAIGIGGTLVGLAQYVLSGSVSIRLGHGPVQGSDAAAELIVLLLTSLGFAAVGMVLRSRAQRAAVFLPLERALLDAVADALGNDVGRRLRQQLNAVGYVQRPLDWTEINLYNSRDGRTPWPESVLFANRSDDLKLGRVRFSVEGKTFTTDLHAVRGHVFSLVTRPSPRRVATKQLIITRVEILTDPDDSTTGGRSPALLPRSYLKFVESCGTGSFRGWTVLPASETYRVSLPQGDFWVLAERPGNEYVLARDSTGDPRVYRCRTDGEPVEISRFDDALS